MFNVSTITGVKPCHYQVHGSEGDMVNANRPEMIGGTNRLVCL